MTIDVTARHIELGAEVKEHLAEKLGKLERLSDPLAFHVTLSAAKHRRTCHIDARSKGVHLTSEATEDDLYLAIHGAIDALARQIRKNKTSVLSDRREGAETIRRPHQDDVQE